MYILFFINYLTKWPCPRHPLTTPRCRHPGHAVRRRQPVRFFRLIVGLQCPLRPPTASPAAVCLPPRPSTTRLPCRPTFVSNWRNARNGLQFFFSRGTVERGISGHTATRPTSPD